MLVVHIGGIDDLIQCYVTFRKCSDVGVNHIGGIADKLRSYGTSFRGVGIFYAWVLQAGVSLQTKRP